MAMRLLINCPFVSELKGVTFACFLVDISAHFSRDGCIHLAISWCCSGWVRMWLLGQGVSFNAQDSMHPALISGYKEYSPQRWR
jgi:hypothetical protein